MSFRHLKIVRDLRLKGSSKSILMVLADRADEHGQCYPSLKTIATGAGVSRSTAAEQLRKLKEAGLVQWSERKREDGSLSSNIYTLKLPPEESGLPRPESGLGSPESGLPPVQISDYPRPESGLLEATVKQQDEDLLGEVKKPPSKTKIQPITFDGREFGRITDEDADRWERLAPNVDIGSELERAALWLSENPAKKNLRLFLHNWLDGAEKRLGQRNHKPLAHQ